jgi:hypothetical protein
VGSGHSAHRLQSNGWNYQDGGVLVIDDAQTSYRDAIFWNDLKSISRNMRYRVITFASHGSIDGDLTLSIEPARIISLRPSTLHPSIALLLTAEEFAEFVSVEYLDHLLEESLLDSTFRLANGHVGTCEDLINIIISHDVSLHLS